MPHALPSLHLLRRIGWLIAPTVAPAARAPMAEGSFSDAPLPDPEGWLPMRRFAPNLDACGCSLDYWIRSGETQMLAFYCDREFDGRPAGWFDLYGEPAGFVPDSFRPAED